RTRGHISPPSISLGRLGDVLSSAFQQAQLNQGIYSPETVSVGDLFIGAIVPGLLLVGFYIVYILLLGVFRPAAMPGGRRADEADIRGAALWGRVIRVLLPPLALILAVLGSIIGGLAAPTEAAAVGATGALAMAMLRRELSFDRLREIVHSTARISSMVFLILIGASVFSLVFRGYSGDELVRNFLVDLPGGTAGAVIVVMLVMFLLGFVLDFIEITFVVVPIVGPVLLAMGLDPVWLGIMIAINLQTSFLTPPFGFALFYLRGVAPPDVETSAMYRGVMPFVALQLLMLIMLAAWPELVTWLPDRIYD
ncbi:MAG: TRAP transporter large permease subunit, partial [Gammaproteobacteria bacterium]